MVIRPATGDDVPALGRLAVSLVRLHHDFDPRRFIAPTAGTERGYGSYLGSQVGDSRVFVLVAEEGGRVIGYTYAGLEEHDYMALRGPAGALYDIVVDPSWRGRGVGRRLLDATIAELSKRGAHQIVLSTAEQNAAAQRLFEAAGFRRTMIEMTRDL